MRSAIFLLLVSIGCLLIPDVMSAQSVDSTAFASETTLLSVKLEEQQIHEKNPERGVGLENLGLGLMLGGAGIGTLCLINVAVALNAFSPNESSDIDIISVIGSFGAYAYAVGFLISSAVALAGVPIFSAGKALQNCDRHWLDARYRGPNQHRFSVIADISAGKGYIQAGITPGYHFNQSLFVGGGVAPIYDYSSSRNKTLIPIYGQVRLCSSYGVLSPYVSVSPGYDLMTSVFYGSVDLGIRIRLKPNSPASTWTAIRGIYCRDLKSIGLALDLSF